MFLRPQREQNRDKQNKVFLRICVASWRQIVPVSLYSGVWKH